jgi:hypothetical protein
MTTPNAWLGRQKQTAQVLTIPIVNNRNATYSLAFPNGKTLTVPGDSSGTAAATLADIVAAWTLLTKTEGEFAEVTATVGTIVANSLVLTANTAGTPFGPITATASGGAVAAAPVQAVPVASSGGTLVNGQAYFWVVTAYNDVGETVASNEKTLTMSTPNLQATISWAAVTNAVGYNIYRGTTTGAENHLVGTVTAPTLSFLDTGLTGTVQSPPGSSTAGAGSWGSVATTIANTSPSDAADVLNWSAGHIPTAGDLITLSNTAVPILWNLSATVGVTVVSITSSNTFTGTVGLPTTNTSSGLPYVEYRETYWQLAATNYYIGDTVGQGCGLFKIDAQAIAVTGNVFNMATGAVTGEEAFQFIGTNAANVWRVSGGTAGFGINGEPVTLLTLDVGSLNVGGASSPTVRCGPNATLTTIVDYGAPIEIHTAITTATLYGTAALTMYAGNVTTVNLNDDSSFIYYGAGTISQIYLGEGCTVDFNENQVPRTVTNMTVYGPATVKDGGQTVSWTNAIIFSGFNPFASSGFDFGANITALIA